MAELSWTITERGEVSEVRLEGELTELTDLKALLPALPPRVVFDLAGVRRINSCGIREWIGFVGELERAGKSFELERCSVAVVAQLNMISNFAGNAPVHSVFAPYFCPNCNQEHARLLTLGPGVEQRLEDVVPCPRCQKPMEFDDLPQKFLAFLSARRLR